MEKDEILRKYLDGELSGEEEREALHMIADDPQMRQMLSFERSVKSTFSNTEMYDQPEVPDGFTDRVMHNIEHAEQPEPNISLTEQIKGWINRLAVKKEYRGRGIGTKLVKKLEKIFKDKGFKIWAALIEPDNPEAMKFFENLAYEDSDIKYYSKRESDKV